MKEYSLGIGKKQALEILKRYSPGQKSIPSKFTWWCIFYKDEALALDYVNMVQTIMQEKVDYQKRVLSLDAAGKKELLHHLSSMSDLLPEKYVYITWASDNPLTEKVCADIKAWQENAQYGTTHNWILCIPYPKDSSFFVSEVYRWVSMNSTTVHILQGNKGEWSQWLKDNFDCKGKYVRGASRCLSPDEQRWVLEHSEFHSLDVMNNARILAMIKASGDWDSSQLDAIASYMQATREHDAHVAYWVLYHIMEKNWEELSQCDTRHTAPTFMIYVLEDWFQLILRSPKELTSTWKGELSSHNIPDRYHALFMHWKENADKERMKNDIIHLSQLARLGNADVFWGLLQYLPTHWSRT